MKTKIAKKLIESFGLVHEAADPAKVNRFIQLVNSGQMSGELIQLQRELRPDMMSSDALAKAFSKMNGMMADKIGNNKNPQAKPAAQPTKPVGQTTKPTAQPAKPASDPKTLALQKSLIAKGAKIAADGIMGPQTQAAIKQFGSTAAPTATPNKPQPSHNAVGGGLQAKLAAQAYDDMPTIKPENTHITNSSPTSDIVNAASKLPQEQRAELHNKLKAKFTNQSGWNKNIFDPMSWDGVGQYGADGKMTPEFTKLIDKFKTDSVGFVNAMKAQNQKKG